MPPLPDTEPLFPLRVDQSTVALYECKTDGVLGVPSWPTPPADGTTEVDLSPNGYDASVPATSLIQEPSPFFGGVRSVGKTASALNIFGGAGGPGEAIQNDIISDGDAGCVECIVRFERPSDLTNNKVIEIWTIYGGAANNQVSLWMFDDGGTKKFAAQFEGSGSPVEINEPVPASVLNNPHDYHYLVMNWDTDAETISLFINGQEAATAQVGLFEEFIKGNAIDFGLDEHLTFAGIRFSDINRRPYPRPWPIPVQWRPTLKELDDGGLSFYANGRERGTAKRLVVEYPGQLPNITGGDLNKLKFVLIGAVSAVSIPTGTGQIKLRAAEGSRFLSWKQPGSGSFGAELDITGLGNMVIYTTPALSAEGATGFFWIRETLLPSEGTFIDDIVVSQSTDGGFINLVTSEETKSPCSGENPGPEVSYGQPHQSNSPLKSFYRGTIQNDSSNYLPATELVTFDFLIKAEFTDDADGDEFLWAWTKGGVGIAGTSFYFALFRDSSGDLTILCGHVSTNQGEDSLAGTPGDYPRDGEIHHVRCTYDGPELVLADLKLYVDDMVTPIATSSTTNDLGPIVGGDQFGIFGADVRGEAEEFLGCEVLEACISDSLRPSTIYVL